VQVDPLQPTLKAPGSERLKLEHEELLSNFAFNCNLRRYEEVGDLDVEQGGSTKLLEVGRCRLTLSNPG
jgi:hypothetical protein